ncbi:GNAT family N-acetyltransferase [Sneathiella chinensis]|uniref:Acetyltransferase n=1 Tax=Sneathiella chinensis TaxID=349750 RepID=A0ABQ5U7T2_9PROT|nr:GNAT family N-acetyltransferase [Sneathiella chinensis]GLQ07263.1 acetyltransferase [Sneathiella chinensis]
MLSEKITIRKAREQDILGIVRLLADDPLGAQRETATEPLALFYRDAFAKMERQEGNDYYIAEEDGQILGCMQVTMIAGLSRKGMTRCQIEGVRIASDCRSAGVGRHMIKYAIRLAKQAGCGLVQLTTDKTREDAHRFYEKLGFEPSHVGMKLDLTGK